MLTSIKMTRFRGSQSLELALGATTAIVGRNSSGKTSVLHAIRLVCEVLGSVMEDPDTRPRALPSTKDFVICEKSVVADPGRFIALADWRQLFTDGAVSDGSQLAIELHFEVRDAIEQVRLELTYGRNAQLLVTVRIKSPQIADAVAGLPARSKHLPTRVMEWLRRTHPLAVLVPAFSGVTSAEEYRTQPVVDRLLGGGDQSHIVRNLLARMASASLERMNAFLRRAIGAHVSDRTPQVDAETAGHLTVKYRDSNGELELSSAGSGLIAMVALFAAMERTRARRGNGQPVIFLLDEPEAHLHPRLQGDVGEELARLAAEFGNQLILATHSVEMINRLGRRPGTTLLTVDRATGGAAKLTSEDQVIAALDEFCDLTPFASLSFLATRRVLFHEGPTDAQALNACARLYFRSDDDRMARWRQFVLVPLDGVGNVSAKGVLERVLTPKLFVNLDAKRPVRAALVLDRDWSREPQRAQLRQSQPHLFSIEAVWSRHSIESLFLDVECLAEWLAPHLPGTSHEELRSMLQVALSNVDTDQELEDQAIDGRTPVHRRPDKTTQQQATDKAAHKLARDEVRKEPEVWQHGKSRAKRVLEELRKQLDAQGARLRGSLLDLVERAPSDKIGDPHKAIPDEIRRLLDECVLL
jgi:predicted ATPase